MAAYYNEIDPFCAEWLRNLMIAGVIADGEIDTRDIRDVPPSDLNGFTQHHFFAGIGIWSYALRQAGWDDARPIWTGSCPCQPFSAAGRGEGFADERHLWPHWLHLIGVRRPAILAGEQVGGKNGHAWIDLVSADMEGMDYAFGAVDSAAAGFGAPQIRNRLYWLAGADRGQRLRLPESEGSLPYWAEVERLKSDGLAECGGPRNDRQTVGGFWTPHEMVETSDGRWRPIEPGLEPLVDGHPGRMECVGAYGNALVAPQAIEFCKLLVEIAQ